ncbi:MAG: nickel-dependent lactate racemase [Pirellulales bacterium]|nr:nickel-dependent lactate racemase [Pirellulales bacterium]
MSTLPQMFRVRQRFEGSRLADPYRETRDRLAGLDLGQRVRPGQSVAVTAGSRGIANIHLVMKAIVDHLRELGTKPFLVPAMGSHGGGTAAGQRAIVEGYGMTEEFLGCPIRATMETVVVCQTAEGFPVHFDRFAAEADHTVVCGRIKPHTNFVGDIESGLMKMMLIGLGKHEGAKIYHRAIMDYSFGQILRIVAGHVLEKCRILCGVGIVENAYDETALIDAVAPADFERREKELLRIARGWMPRLPFERADLLILDQIGKNISGAGMDTNVVGRKYNDHKAQDDEWPKIKRIAIRDLTPETHGNGAGLGIAEFCAQRLLDKLDYHITKINCLTGGHPTGAMLPVHYDTEREMLLQALSTVGLVEPPQARVLWARNTLHLGEVECSTAYLDEARSRADLDILTEPRAIQFDASGDLVDFLPVMCSLEHEATAASA